MGQGGMYNEVPWQNWRGELNCSLYNESHCITCNGHMGTSQVNRMTDIVTKNITFLQLY